MVEVGLYISSLAVNTGSGEYRERRGFLFLGNSDTLPLLGFSATVLLFLFKYFLKVLTKPACLLHREPPRKEWLYFFPGPELV